MTFQTNLIYFKTESYKKKDGDYGYRHTLLDGDGNKYTYFTDVDLWQSNHRDIQQYDLLPVNVTVYKKDNSYNLILSEVLSDD